MVAHFRVESILVIAQAFHLQAGPKRPQYVFDKLFGCYFYHKYVY